MNVQTQMKRSLILFFAYAGIASYCATKTRDNRLDQIINFPKVDILLKDADLIAATQALTKQTGIQFLVIPSEQPFKKINLSLKRLPADLAIQYLCKAAGAWVEQDASGIFIIRVGNTPEKPIPELDMVVQRIKVEKMDAQDIYNQLIKSREGSLSKPVHSINTPNIKSDITVEPEKYFPNPNLIPEDAAQQYTPGSTSTFPSYNSGGLGGGAAASTSLSAGQGLVPQNIEYLTYDPTDNSLVVKGTEEAIRKLQQTVTTLDKAPKQILITVEFITTQRNHGRDIGSDVGYASNVSKPQGGSFGTGRFVGRGGYGPQPSTPTNNDDTTTTTSDGRFTNYNNPIGLFLEYGKLALDIRANLSTSNGKIINVPILRTLNNQPAVIENNDEKTFILMEQQQNTGIGTRDVPKTENVKASTRLVVTPRYNEGDDTITAYIQPQIEDFDPNSTGVVNGVKQLTGKSTQTTKLVTRSKNGETIMIGGLTKRNRTRVFNRIPILGDILPGLFGRTTDSYVDNDLRIFITMSVIPDDPSQLFTPAGA